MHAKSKNIFTKKHLLAAGIAILALIFCITSIVIAASKVAKENANQANIAKYSTEAQGEETESYVIDLNTEKPTVTYPFVATVNSETTVKCSVTINFPEGTEIPANVLNLTISDDDKEEPHSSTVSVDTSLKGTSYTITNDNWVFDVNDKEDPEEPGNNNNNTLNNEDPEKKQPLVKNMTLTLDGIAGSSAIISTIDINGIEVIVNYEQVD